MSLMKRPRIDFRLSPYLAKPDNILSAIKYFKYQNTNTKQITMIEIQNPKQSVFDLL